MIWKHLAPNRLELGTYSSTPDALCGGVEGSSTAEPGCPSVCPLVRPSVRIANMYVAVSSADL